MMKKLVSILLTSIMVLSGTVIGFAESLNLPSSSIKETILSHCDIEDKSLLFIEDDSIVDREKLENYDVVVQHNLLNEGEEKFTIHEDGKSNELLIKANGDLLLDGEKVTVSTLDETGNVIAERILNVNVIPFAQRSYKYPEPPAGTTSSDYDTFVDEVEKVIGLGDRIISAIGITTFVSIVATAINATGLIGIGLSVFLGALYEEALSTIPYSNYLSYRQEINKVMYAGEYIMITQHLTEFYGNKNFTGWLGDTEHYIAYKTS